MATHVTVARHADGKIVVRNVGRATEGIFMTRSKDTPRVGLLMGSDSDWDIMRHAVAQLDAFGIVSETRVVSAHRMPDDMFEYAEDALPRGLRCIIAGAGGAAHLPGMLAAKTTVPVLGVPVPSKYLRGEDSLYSIVQMPKGIPVATFAIGEAGAANAGLFAAALIAATDPVVAKKLAAFRLKQTSIARAMRVPPAS
jgi:5-(carboxyamino)imidazole ribonucleotide mutase